jgi:hypothetical protein
VENEINDLEQSLKSAETPADIMDGLKVGLKLFGLMMLGLKPYQQKELIQGAVAECALEGQRMALTLKCGPSAGRQVFVRMPILHGQLGGARGHL